MTSPWAGETNERLLERLENTEGTEEYEVDEAEVEPNQIERRGDWLGDDLTCRTPTTGIRIMAFNRQRHPLNNAESIKCAAAYMQAMRVDVAVYHECGMVAREDVQIRIENAAAENGCTRNSRSIKLGDSRFFSFFVVRAL